MTKKITTIKEYISLFPNNKRMHCLALQEAQKVRQFEIELYWKRTMYFWGFITIIYGALFAVIGKDNCTDDCDLLLKFAIFILAGLGFFFSVAWHLVNKGSKFWQENWEQHVSLLEKDLIGPLYNVFLNPEKDVIKGFLHPTKAFDFSVSKVNMWASFIMCICSFFVWVFVTWHFCHWLLAVFTFFISIPLICFMIEHSRGNTDIIENKNSTMLIILMILDRIKIKCKILSKKIRTINVKETKRKIQALYKIASRRNRNNSEEETELNMVQIESCDRN